MAKQLIDQFGRVHDYLRISLTDKCNLRCLYCMPHEGMKFKPNTALMQQDEIVEIAKTFVEFGVNKIRITGGEPLARQDAPEILMSLSKLPVDLSITTNAVLLQDYFEVLKKARIETLNISLDTLNEDKFSRITRRNHFQTVMSNIEGALQRGFEVKVNSVMMKEMNEEELLDFIEWTIDTPISMRFIEYMPFNGNRWEYEKVVSYKSILEVVEGKFPFYRIENGPNSTSKNFKIEGAKGSFGIISTITNPFCEGCNRIRLTADGKIKNCLFAQQELDLLTNLRKGEEIEPLIVEAINRKHFSRGGLKDFELKEAKEVYNNNRSMISIGG